MIKIKAPMSRLEEAEALCAAGADELFCGIEPAAWRRDFGGFCVNQRPTRANFQSFSILEKAIRVAHRNHVKVHVALNAFFYAPGQYALARRIAKDIARAGADGIIFSNPLLLSQCADLLPRLNIIAGTDALIFNHRAMRFFKEAGASRVTFPRSMSLTEIQETVSRGPLIESEVFILNGLCFFEDGLCAYCKTQSPSLELKNTGFKNRSPLLDYFRGTPQTICQRAITVHRHSLKNRSRHTLLKKKSFWPDGRPQGCGMCALYELAAIGITAVKILDRNMPSAEKFRATRAVFRARESLRACLSDGLNKHAFREKCRTLFQNTQGRLCRINDCYYPGIFMAKRTAHAH